MLSIFNMKLTLRGIAISLLTGLTWAQQAQSGSSSVRKYTNGLVRINTADSGRSSSG